MKRYLQELLLMSLLRWERKEKPSHYQPHVVTKVCDNGWIPMGKDVAPQQCLVSTDEIISTEFQRSAQQNGLALLREPK
jgi:hypothetical protein